MGLFITKLHKFIFNGGAVARPNRLDLAAVERGEVEISRNNLTGLTRSLSHPTGNLLGAWLPAHQALTRLFHVEQICFRTGIHEGE